MAELAENSRSNSDISCNHVLQFDVGEFWQPRCREQREISNALLNELGLFRNLAMYDQASLFQFRVTALLTKVGVLSTANKNLRTR